MKARSATTLALCAITLGMGACSTMQRRGANGPPPPPPLPPSSLEGRTAGTGPAPGAELPKGCNTEKCARRTLAVHRQYFDQRHKRYYFYDPARRAYFWEDGSPKT